MIPSVEAAVETRAGTVPVAVQGGEGAETLILAHGAGAGMRHPFMREVAAAISASGITVVRFNFAYIEAGRKAPDRQPVLEETYAAVVAEVRRRLSPPHLFLGGKSMGGRIASHLPGRGVECDGLVFLGYPLHPPGRPDRLRDAHLLTLKIPMLFVEGTRDPFCPLDTLGEVRGRLHAPNDLLVIDDGDHSFKVRKSSGRDSDAALAEVANGVIQWLRKLVA
jgi:uncharacterized protein